MTILALDLGTKCGWAIDYGLSGVWNLKPSTHDSAGQRYRTFKDKLSIAVGLDFIVYEEVHRHLGVEAAHVYGGLVALLQTFCLEHKIEYQGVPVQTIKKHATGKGNAKKEDMIRAAVNKYKSVNVIDDNHADALCLLSWATDNLIS